MKFGKQEILLCGIILVPIVILCISAFYIYVIHPFSEDRRYIKAEIHRSGDETESRHWKRELKKLYILQIPVFGRQIVKHMQ